MSEIAKDTDDRWSGYYKATSGRNPRKLLLEALPNVSNIGTALDLGAGDMTDSIYLLQKGFSVVALDSSSTSEEIAHSVIEPKFSFVRSEYDAYPFPVDKFDLISAQLALPFNRPGTFKEVIERIKVSLKSGGVFTGHFFGPNDEWNTDGSDMTFCTRKEIEAMLSDLNIVLLREEESDKETAAGVMKHWHVFDVIASKP